METFIGTAIGTSTGTGKRQCTRLSHVELGRGAVSNVAAEDESAALGGNSALAPRRQLRLLDTRCEVERDVGRGLRSPTSRLAPDAARSAPGGSRALSGPCRSVSECHSLAEMQATPNRTPASGSF